MNSYFKIFHYGFKVSANKGLIQCHFFDKLKADQVLYDTLSITYTFTVGNGHCFLGGEVFIVPA